MSRARREVRLDDSGDDDDDVDEAIETIRVVCRVRPQSAFERERGDLNAVECLTDCKTLQVDHSL
jgi:hypothetical protein